MHTHIYCRLENYFATEDYYVNIRWFPYVWSCMTLCTRVTLFQHFTPCNSAQTQTWRLNESQLGNRESINKTSCSYSTWAFVFSKFPCASHLKCQVSSLGEVLNKVQKCFGSPLRGGADGRVHRWSDRLNSNSDRRENRQTDSSKCKEITARTHSHTHTHTHMQMH